jgi:hypothetical protein
LLFAGIAEQLVARLAARSRLAATIGNLNVATSGDLLTALDSRVARPSIESLTVLGATAATAVSSTDVTGQGGISSGSKPGDSPASPGLALFIATALTGCATGSGRVHRRSAVASGTRRAQPSSVGSGPARPQLSVPAEIKPPKRLGFTGSRPSSTATASICPTASATGLPTSARS